jgi:hypothetical protein
MISYSPILDTRTVIFGHLSLSKRNSAQVVAYPTGKNI